jgi:hypothetical protein
MTRVTWLAFIALLIGVEPTRAVTCEDVRSLSRAEQEYWAKRLNLTQAQRVQIWRACYGDGTPKLHQVGESRR